MKLFEERIEELTEEEERYLEELERYYEERDNELASECEEVYVMNENEYNELEK